LYARTTQTPALHAGTCSPFLQGTTFLPRRFAGRFAGFLSSSNQQSSTVLHAIGAGGSGALDADAWGSGGAGSLGAADTWLAEAEALAGGNAAA
jgi:hypothetical protein